jgi:adenylate cyclase
LIWRQTLQRAGWKLDPSFEDRFRKEITKTELLRVNILVVAILTVYSIGLINLYVSGNDKAASVLKSQIGLLSYFIAFIILYEIVVAALLWRLVRRKKPATIWLQVINLTVETSFPSVFSLLLFHETGNIMVLFTPVLSVYFLFIVLSTLHLNFWMSLATGAIAFIQYYFISLYVIHHAPAENYPSLALSPVFLMGRSLPLLFCGFAAGFVALEIKRRMNVTYQVMNERSRIRQVLGQQVSHAVVDRIINEGALPETDQRMVCVMFLDIRNFTPFASGRTPGEVMAFQNQLFGLAIEAVNKYNGIINQFLGDGFMATFGAPVSYENDCQNAVDAALQILDETQSASEKGQLHPTRLGIGIHYGEAITGNIGTDLRRQYSIVGNVVIQASRIEQLNKEYHSQLLVSKEVKERVVNTNGEYLGMVALKGEAVPVEIFRIR